MLPRARISISCALAAVVVANALTTTSVAANETPIVQAAPPATAAAVSANRTASAIYSKYRGTLATVAASKATIKKYGGRAKTVITDQSALDAANLRLTNDKVITAAWVAALAGAKKPATFAPADDNVIAAQLRALAKKSVKVRTKAIRKKLAAARAKQNSDISAVAKATKKLAKDTTAANKVAAKVAAARDALATANAATPGVADEFTTALDALNAVTGPSAYTAVRGTVQAINPGPEGVPGQQVGLETVTECGTVTKVKDGDTVMVLTTDGKTLEVRNTAIQATEVAHPPIPAQCFSNKAKSRMLDLTMPKNSAGVRVGATVQLRALFADSVNLHNAPRPYRSIYVFDSVTGGFTYDVQRDLAQRGLVLWFPVYKPTDPARETYYNGEYLNDINIAAAQRLGIFAPQGCGSPTLTLPDGTLRNPQYDITPLLHVSWSDANEYIDIKNPSTTTALNLSRWKLRNKNLEFFTFPDGSVLPAGAVGRLYTRGIPATNTNPFVWAWNRPAPNINSPQIINCSGLSGQDATDCSTANAGFLMGTAVYLMDYQAGTNASTGMLLGGNLRAWAHVPCNYMYDTNTIGSSGTCNPSFTMATSVLETQGVVGAALADAKAALVADGYTTEPTVVGTGATVTKAVLTYTGFNTPLVTLTLG